MKRKPAQPPVPKERAETIRKEIIALIRMRPLTAKEISAGVAIPEKAVYGHLEHIQLSRKREKDFVVTPAKCKGCGFVFRKRDRLTPPGKCPVCRREAIEDPLFSISIGGKE